LKRISDKYQIFDKNEVEILAEQLESGKLSGTSVAIQDYEDDLSQFFDAKFAVAVSSGTAAIQVALFSLGLSKGDKVMLTPTCPMMTVYPIIFAGLVPVFVDTEADSFGFDIEDVVKKFDSKVRAVIDIPMWGYPMDVKKRQEFCHSHDLLYILDLAQAHGSKFGGKYLSKYCDVACFSTHDRKILSTGEGGFILTDDRQTAESAKSFTQFGFMKGVDFGLNYKLGALQATIGKNRLKQVNSQLVKRKENSDLLRSLIKNNSVSEFKITERGTANYYTYLLSLRFKDNLGFIKYLEEKGIPSDITRYSYLPLYELPAFLEYGTVCANAELLSKTITTIPVHPGITVDDIQYIAECINLYEER